jgi:hypothetical protein
MPSLINPKMLPLNNLRQLQHDLNWARAQLQRLYRIVQVTKCTLYQIQAAICFTRS